ncbi:winged helix-turn-helix domain-containing protein [Saccharothrix sp. BKS2]|uniref:winged helix-turn-helix domain-containing protein n=1 Tax=Saccharothrix sp. BKS2 TaxID=3064400 RepID=UPI0039ECC36A
MDATPGLAAYERVVQSIKDEIASGQLAPMQKLRGNRKLAEEHGVALATLQKALKVLEDEGWVTLRPAVGVFVNNEPGQARKIDVQTVIGQLDQLQATVESLAERVRRLEERSA